VTKVLYIEHDDDNLYMLKMRLERIDDFEVLTSDDSEQGCKLASAERPDVMLIDLEMRVDDRWEVARRLKKDAQTGTSRSSACPPMRWTASARRLLPLAATSLMPNRSTSRLWSAPFDVLSRTRSKSSSAGQDGGPPGKRTVNTEPFPGSLATVMSPPII